MNSDSLRAKFIIIVNLPEIGQFNSLERSNGKADLIRGDGSGYVKLDNLLGIILGVHDL